MGFIKKNILIVILGFFLILSIMFYIYLQSSIISQNEVLVFEREGRQKLEDILTNTLILAEFEDHTIDEFESIDDISNDPIILKLDDLADDFLTSDSDRKYFSKDPKLLITGNGILMNWEALKGDFTRFYDDRDLDKFYKAGEIYFNNLNTTITKVDKYIVGLENNVQRFKIYSIVDICVGGLLIVLMVFQKFFKEKQERLKKENEILQKENEEKLAKEKELEKELAKIDEETKLHSKVKCEELFDTSVDLPDIREISMLMFGLDNTDNSNNLIISFAEILKKAVSVLDDEPFIARYESDEFLVYIEKINEEDVKTYVEKIKELVSEFNEDNKDNDEELSYVTGYSITTEGAESVTLRELFDVAISDMKYNKELSKQKEMSGDIDE